MIWSALRREVQRAAGIGQPATSRQNIPNPERDEFKIRRAFIAAQGFVVGDSDYGQLEMRIAASLAMEPQMITPMLNGLDMHCWTAHRMSSISYEDIKAAYDAKESGDKLTPAQKELCLLRSQGKLVGFETMYGAGPMKIGEELKIDYREALALIDEYFNGYPLLKQWFSDNEGWCAANLKATTRRGRIRRLPGFGARGYSRGTYKEAVRAGNNHPIQGEAAEIVKHAQINIFLDQELWDADVRMTLQVHDELVFDVPEDLAGDPDFEGRVNGHMQDPFHCGAPLAVPLECGLHYGASWEEAK